MDLQKVGDVIFNNEKYNILKPTVHVITDYFKDHVLRTENKDPGARIFIDHNGFRHTWTGFGKKTKSLRKTDLDHKDGDVEDTDVKSNDDVEITTATVNSSEDGNHSNETNEQQGKKTSEENKEEDSANAGAESKNTTATLNIITEQKGSKVLGLKHKMRQVGSTKSFVRNAPKNEKTENDPKIESKAGKDRTVAKTTFFCPFLGVITMSAFID
ncbi:hypothetical protein B5X24_HaOG210868 [Helicoverpa armigera]|uniref:Uncharacterized protein n=1 Tax=Helicoverpa armigera TaxID=29058 RepID=A0A2W1BG30_HELAM|nr:hypothetical protein B5X24_HaOG210868 [Helicoverpa armigera]